MEEKTRKTNHKYVARTKKRSYKRSSQRLISTVSITAIVPAKSPVSLVKVKEAMRADFGLAPAPPEDILGSIFDYGFQKYSADGWAAIETLRVVQELPSMPAWARLLAGLFGLGIAVQGFVDIRNGLAGRPRPQVLTKVTTPEFQFPKSFSLPASALPLVRD